MRSRPSPPRTRRARGRRRAGPRPDRAGRAARRAPSSDRRPTGRACEEAAVAVMRGLRGRRPRPGTRRPGPRSRRTCRTRSPPARAARRRPGRASRAARCTASAIDAARMDRDPFREEPFELVGGLADQDGGPAALSRSRQQRLPWSRPLPCPPAIRTSGTSKASSAAIAATGIVAWESLTQRTPRMLPNRLEAMRHAGEGPDRDARSAGAGAGQAGGEGRAEDVGEHVATGQRDLAGRAARTRTTIRPAGSAPPQGRPGGGPRARTRLVSAAAARRARGMPGSSCVEDDDAVRAATARRDVPSPLDRLPPSRGGRDGRPRCSCTPRRRHPARSSAAGAPRARGRPSRIRRRGRAHVR